MTHLLLFTIGPVQSFIAQARKTKDLYAGSQILSQLCKVGIDEAEKTFKAEIIFPFIDTSWQNQSLPNRFIARLPKHASRSFQEIGEDIELKVKESFESMATKLLTTKIKGSLSLDFKTNFWNQIKGHLDIHWVVVPIKDDETYLQAFEKTERILGSVKNLRSFTQNAEIGRKCSLDGQNNALFFSHLYKKPNFAKDAVQVYSGNLGSGEGLSAVSMIKRNFETARFSSTAKIALMHNEHKLPDKIKLHFENYKNIFTKDKFANAVISYGQDCNLTYDEDSWLDEFDHQLLFIENISDKTVPNVSQRECALHLFDKIEKHFKDKYYAIIHFDGDKMGSLISGSRLQNETDKSNEKLPIFQKRVSELLSEFSKWASETCLTSPKGETVYAGGDDFLGFVNLTHLLKVMQDLQEGFECRVNKKLKADYELDADFTFSAGVVIAHYKEPLSLVLEQARNAEKVAKDKNKGNRNAFCLVAAKGSGETHQTCFRWNLNTLPIAQKLVSWLNEDKISKKFIVSFAVEMRGLTEDGLLNGIDYDKIITAELKRLMLRAKASSTDKVDVQIFASELFSLYENQNNENPKLGIDNFLQFLYICDFISRHINESPKQPKPELV